MVGVRSSSGGSETNVKQRRDGVQQLPERGIWQLRDKCLYQIQQPTPRRKGGREGGREGGRDGGMVGGREGGKEKKGHCMLHRPQANPSPGCPAPLPLHLVSLARSSCCSFSTTFLKNLTTRASSVMEV